MAEEAAAAAAAGDAPVERVTTPNAFAPFRDEQRRGDEVRAGLQTTGLVLPEYTVAVAGCPDPLGMRDDRYAFFHPVHSVLRFYGYAMGEGTMKPARWRLKRPMSHQTCYAGAECMMTEIVMAATTFLTEYMKEACYTGPKEWRFNPTDGPRDLLGYWFSGVHIVLGHTGSNGYQVAPTEAAAGADYLHLTRSTLRLTGGQQVQAPEVMIHFFGMPISSTYSFDPWAPVARDGPHAPSSSPSRRFSVIITTHVDLVTA